MYPFEDLHTEIKTNQIHIEASKPHQQENFTGLDKEKEKKEFRIEVQIINSRSP